MLLILTFREFQISCALLSRGLCFKERTALRSFIISSNNINSGFVESVFNPQIQRLGNWGWNGKHKYTVCIVFVKVRAFLMHTLSGD